MAALEMEAAGASGRMFRAERQVSEVSAPARKPAAGLWARRASDGATLAGMALAALVLSSGPLAAPLAAQPRAESAATLEQRVRQLEDEKEIREVLIRYGEYLDARDYAAYAALFASDGVWAGGFGSATGPAAIEAMLLENLGAPEPGYVNKTSFHLITTVLVDVAGDTATAHSRYLFFTAADERPDPILAGRYEDEMVREDGAWKIRRRTTHGVIPWRDGNAPTPTERPAALDDRG